MIVTGLHKSRSLFTHEELDESIRRELEAMSEDELAVFFEMLDNPHMENDLYALELDREMVSVQQFIEDDYYMGAIGRSLYQPWKDDLVEIFDSGQYDSAIVVGGIGSGKSTFSHFLMLRMLYEASCLKNPAVSYGLAHGSVIGFCNLAKTKEVARRVSFEQIGQKMEQCPYFKYDFAPIKSNKDEIIFPKNLALIAGSSTDSSIIGMNIIGGIIEEANFWATMKKGSSLGINANVASKAEAIYDSLRRRMKSRYMKNGRMPGILAIVSSKTDTDSFTDRLVREEQNSETGGISTFVRDRSIIELKPFGDKYFRVLVGTQEYGSKILGENEDVSELKDAIIVDIPDEFLGDFERNINGSLRDLAGIATMTISNFISKVEKIREMVDPTREHPFYCPMMSDTSTWNSRYSYKMDWHKLAIQKDNGDWVPKLNPEAPRHVHFDPGLTGDAFAMCIAHVAGMVPIQTDGDTIEYQPHFVVDFVLQIQGQKDEEVIFSKVRELCYSFSDHGFHLAEFSMDTYQSRELIQALEQQGYKAGIYSVDTGISSKTENAGESTALGRIPKSKQAYWYLRTAIYEGRVKCYDYPILAKELRHLEDTPEKVDHPEGKSKDLSDALCGVIWTLFRAGYRGSTLLPSKGISVNPGQDGESLRDFHESIQDRNVTSDLSRRADETTLESIKGVKVYQKSKPKALKPTYTKVADNGEETDLLKIDIDDFIQRG